MAGSDSGDQEMVDAGGRAPATPSLMSGTQTVEDTWQLAPPTDPDRIDLERFCAKIRAGFDDLLKNHGGPDAYLRSRYATPQEMQGWVDYLATLQDQQVCYMSLDPALETSSLAALSEVWCHDHGAGTKVNKTYHDQFMRYPQTVWWPVHPEGPVVSCSSYKVLNLGAK